ncbi:hypothetical protein FRC01_001089 [Tulasnella sp. 417]|nr:hypothetical protein FRC01_001089 [Tulasnella sp. 417]
MSTVAPFFPLPFKERSKGAVEALRRKTDSNFRAGAWVERRHSNGDRYFHETEGGLLTEFDPREAANATVFQDAADEILQLLAEENILEDVSIVLGLENETRGISVTYYLVNNNRRAIFWLEDETGVIPRISPGHTENCLDAFSLRQYFHHVQHFPPPIIDTPAEEGLIARLLASQVDGNLSPLTPDECRHYLAVIEYNKGEDIYSSSAKSEADRMADVGLLLSLIYRQQHDEQHGRHTGRNIRARNGAPVAIVQRRDPAQPDWPLLVEVLINPDRPLGMGMAYSLILTGANAHLEQGGLVNAMCFLVSLTVVIAALLFCFASPALCLVILANIFEDPANARLRHWILSSFMAFNIFVYGCLLSAFSQYLDIDGPKHQHSMAGLVLVTFVLALPPAFHVWRLSRDVAHHV